MTNQFHQMMHVEEELAKKTKAPTYVKTKDDQHPMHYICLSINIMF